jgi:hypothetical protein
MEVFLEKFQGMLGLPQEATKEDIENQHHNSEWGTD